VARANYSNAPAVYGARPACARLTLPFGAGPQESEAGCAACAAQRSDSDAGGGERHGLGGRGRPQQAVGLATA